MRETLHYATVVLLSIITAGVTTYALHFGRSLAPKDAMVVVPALSGLTEKDARTNMNALGLVFLVGSRKPTAEAEDDTVIAQSIPAGQRTPRGQSVSVTIARSLPKVPDVVGHSLSDAKRLLESLEFKLEEGEPAPSNDVPRGQVVSQQPAANTPYDKSKPVVVRVSSGPTEVVVPKLLGQTVDKAQETLKAAGLEFGGIVWTELGETPTGIVLNQNPLPDVKAKPGDTVKITVNR